MTNVHPQKMMITVHQVAKLPPSLGSFPLGGWPRQCSHKRMVSASYCACRPLSWAHHTHYEPPGPNTVTRHALALHKC